MALFYAGNCYADLRHLPPPHDNREACCSGGETCEGYIYHTGERCAGGYIRFQCAEGESNPSFAEYAQHYAGWKV